MKAHSVRRRLRSPAWVSSLQCREEEALREEETWSHAHTHLYTSAYLHVLSLMHIWNIMLSEQILIALLFLISFEKVAFDSNAKEIYCLQHFCRLRVLLQKVFSVRMIPHHDTGNNLWYFIFLFQEISSKNLFSCWGDTWWCWQSLMGPNAMLFLNVLNLQQTAEWIAFWVWRSGTKKSQKTNKQTNK